MDLFVKKINRVNELNSFSNDDKKSFVAIILCLRFIELPNEIIEIIILKYAQNVYHINSLVAHSYAMNILLFPHSRLQYTNSNKNILI